jgi:hypothetical protein
MTDPTELPLTDARMQMLQQVADQLVTYDFLTGRWHLGGGDVLGGWAGRTLSELRRAGYILILTGESTMSTVDLTERGRSALSG